jgi:hypothetical protein
MKKTVTGIIETIREVSNTTLEFQLRRGKDSWWITCGYDFKETLRMIWTLKVVVVFDLENFDLVRIDLYGCAK